MKTTKTIRTTERKGETMIMNRKAVRMMIAEEIDSAYDEPRKSDTDAVYRLFVAPNDGTEAEWGKAVRDAFESHITNELEVA